MTHENWLNSVMYLSMALLGFLYFVIFTQKNTNTDTLAKEVERANFITCNEGEKKVLNCENYDRKRRIPCVWECSVINPPAINPIEINGGEFELPTEIPSPNI